MKAFSRGLAGSIGMSCAVLLVAVSCRDDTTSPTETTTAGSQPAAATASATAALTFEQVSAGRLHTCGVTLDSKAYCWGNNGNGQIGNGKVDSSSFGVPQATPALVQGGLAFKQVDAGGIHSCGVTTGNRAYCWGYGTVVGTGVGINTNHPTPVAVAGSHSFRQLSAGFQHTCAVNTDDRAYCWGANQSGQLGDGTTTQRLKPVAVLGGLRFREVSAGLQHTCGVTMTNRAYCWGYNRFGQVGDSSGAWKRLKPVRVKDTREYLHISAGHNHTCAVTPGDRAFCWGTNVNGQIGDGTRTQRRSPRAVAGGLSLNRVSAGGNHTCAINTNNRAFCWGDGGAGQVGDGTFTGRLKPVAVAGNLFFRQLSAGELHTCAKNSSSVAYCWGSNGWGQIGNGDDTQNNDVGTPTPVAAPLGSAVARVSQD